MSTMAELPACPDPTNTEAWKEVHATLMEAVIREREAVDSLQAQRRYWLEELGANLALGKLAEKSVWRKAIALKKKQNSNKQNSKRKKGSTSEKMPAAKKARVKKEEPESVRQRASPTTPEEAPVDSGSYSHWQAAAASGYPGAAMGYGAGASGSGGSNNNNPAATAAGYMMDAAYPYYAAATAAVATATAAAAAPSAAFPQKTYGSIQDAEDEESDEDPF